MFKSISCSLFYASQHTTKHQTRQLKRSSLCHRLPAVCALFRAEEMRSVSFGSVCVTGIWSNNGLLYIALFALFRWPGPFSSRVNWKKCEFAICFCATLSIFQVSNKQKKKKKLRTESAKINDNKRTARSLSDSKNTTSSLINCLCNSI